MAAVEITGLTRSFGDRLAVDGLDLEIGQGELFALLGSNGAGKTTLIKILCCLLEPTEGDAKVLGTSVRADPNAIKQQINVSPQETAVAPNLTVRENLELIAGIYGASRVDAASAATRMIERFALTERARDRAKTLSGGMQRRLSIAMALITEPEILFLDEPTLGLDVRARRDLWKAISSLKGRITVILTTHYLEEAEALADRIGIMHDGRMRAVGTAAELKAQTSLDSIDDVFLALTEREAA